MADQKHHYAPHPQAQVPQSYVAPPMYNASPNAAPGGRRILHVYHQQGWTRRSTQVMDSDKVTPIYTIEGNSGSVFSSKPHMTILNAATGALAGTISFHGFSSSMDLEIHGRPLSLDKPGVFSSGHEFQSQATGGILKWKRDGVFSGGDLICVDQNQQELAVFEISRWALKKNGKFEIAPMIQGLLFDEVLITGIAAMEFAHRQRSSSSAGGGGGG